MIAAWRDLIGTDGGVVLLAAIVLLSWLAGAGAVMWLVVSPLKSKLWFTKYCLDEATTTNACLYASGETRARLYAELLARTRAGAPKGAH